MLGLRGNGGMVRKQLLEGHGHTAPRADYYLFDAVQREQSVASGRQVHGVGGNSVIEPA